MLQVYSPQPQSHWTLRSQPTPQFGATIKFSVTESQYYNPVLLALHDISPTFDLQDHTPAKPPESFWHPTLYKLYKFMRRLSLKFQPGDTVTFKVPDHVAELEQFKHQVYGVKGLQVKKITYDGPSQSTAD